MFWLFFFYSEDRAHTWFYQISNALNYMHEDMFTAHRDIKIDNILLSQNWVAKGKIYINQAYIFKITNNFTT